MIVYHYQVLRFLPDRVNEEFVNLGVVIFEPKRCILRSRFIDKASRVSAFFPDINTRYIGNTLKFLKNEFFQLETRFFNELPIHRTENLEELTRSILPKDDSALIFSEIKKGRDVSLDAACEDLFDRLVLKNITDHEEIELRNDREVWNKIYRTYFERHRISSHLHTHVIKTKNDELHFERSWKNGKWNCFEAVSFNLTRPESVKNKVYKWVGKLDELTSSNEAINLYLLSVLPENDELINFINHKLNKSFDGSKVKVVTEEEAESLAKKFQKEIEEHLD